MPTYSYSCPSCEQTFDRVLPLADYNQPQECPCGATAQRILTPVGFILQGDGWPGKALRVRGQMDRKNKVLNSKSKDQPKGLTLAPNVDGERVDSWAEAKQLAASKGRNTSTYDQQIRQEGV